MIRVLLVDDQALVRAGFRGLIDGAADITVVGEAGNGGEAVAMARELIPDVVLMDLRMPEVDGVTATARITGDARLATVKVLVLTTFTDEPEVFGALRAGASGFLVKDAEPEELLQAVRTIAVGESLLSPRVTQSVIAHFVSTQPTEAAERSEPRELAWLTPREREVVQLVAQGRTNDEIARQLVVSPLTAKTHVSRAMAKVGARDRAQLVVFGYESGLVQPGQYAPGSTRQE